MTARLRAPEENGAILIDPPPDRWPELIEKAQQFDLPATRFLELSFREWRELSRSQVLLVAEHCRVPGEEKPSARSQPWIVTGHQPELFHPGVWIKSFVLSALVQRHGGVGLFMTMDNDTIKQSSIRVPYWCADQMPCNDVRVFNILFDRQPSEVPYEEAVVNDEELFRDFAKRVSEGTRHWPDRPIIETCWQNVPSHRPGAIVGQQLPFARSQLEKKLGVCNHSLLMSWLCDCVAFTYYAGTILFDLPRFHAIYNGCLRKYREQYHIRSRNHPVPELAHDAGWFETPFWAWRPRATHRSRLFARRRDDRLEMRADAGIFASVATTNFSKWDSLAEDGFHIRPRALTTTLFLRLALADVFIHGIGGAIYDELTDNISREFFGAAPPAFAVVSGTLRLPLSLEGPPAVASSRDLQWNPQRHLDAANPLVAERQRLIADVPTTRPGRRERYRALRENLEHLSPLVASEVESARHAEADTASWRRANAILSSRDYSFVLHSEKSLRAFFEKGMAMVTS